MQDEDINLPNVLKMARVLIWIGVIVVIVAPVLFTLPAFWSKLNFTQTSSIGETIGGITAPIVGVLGSSLVFCALMAQVSANKLVQVQITRA